MSAQHRVMGGYKVRCLPFCTAQTEVRCRLLLRMIMLPKSELFDHALPFRADTTCCRAKDRAREKLVSQEVITFSLLSSNLF